MDLLNRFVIIILIFKLSVFLQVPLACKKSLVSKLLWKIGSFGLFFNIQEENYNYV